MFKTIICIQRPITYSGLRQTSAMEHFAKIVNGFKLGSQYVSGIHKVYWPENTQVLTTVTVHLRTTDTTSCYTNKIRYT